MLDARTDAMLAQAESADPELIALTMRYLDDALSDEQFACLDGLLRADPQNRLAFASVTLQMYLIARTDGSLRRVEPAERADVEAVVKIVPVARHWRIGRVRLAAAALVVIGGVVAALVAVSIGGPGRAATARPQRPVAVMVGSDGVSWSSEPRQPGDELTPQTMALESGRLEIEMRGGTSMTVEGPARLTILSGDRIDLPRGRLTAVAVAGFTVSTPRLTVVDLGTRFGVAVDEAGVGQVQVFEGSVRVEYGGGSTVLAAGDAGEVGADSLWRALGADASLPFTVADVEGQIAARKLAPGVLLADARADYRPAFDAGFTTQTPDHLRGVPAARRGVWNYYSSAALEPGDLQLMTYGPGGDSEGAIYRGQVVPGPYDLPAISDSAIFSGEIDNPPGPRELAVHGSKTGPRQYAVVRWTAGADEAGVIRITGHARRLGTESISDGMELAIYVGGRRVFDAVVSDDVQRNADFDLEQVIRGGEHVDFVFGCRATFNNDQTGLRALITWVSASDEQTEPKTD